MANPGDWWYQPVAYTAASTNAFTYNTGITYGATTTIIPQSSGPYPVQLYPQQVQIQQYTPPPVEVSEEYPEIAQLKRRIIDVTQLVAA